MAGRGGQAQNTTGVLLIDKEDNGWLFSTPAGLKHERWDVFQIDRGLDDLVPDGTPDIHHHPGLVIDRLGVRQEEVKNRDDEGVLDLGRGEGDASEGS